MLYNENRNDLLEKTSWREPVEKHLSDVNLNYLKHFAVKQCQAYTSGVHWWMYYSNVESVGSCKFQIHLCILACVMSREFTREAVVNFYHFIFPEFDVNFFGAILFIQSHQLLITHVGMPIWIWQVKCYYYHYYYHYYYYNYWAACGTAQLYSARFFLAQIALWRVHRLREM